MKTYTIAAMAAGLMLRVAAGEPASTFAAEPAKRDVPARGPDRGRERAGAGRYSVDQAISDRAQLNTIAFSGLSFLAGDLGSDSFLPPGKVADYFGFQYMRDIDAAGKGHNTDFLTRIANAMLATLDEAQRGKLAALAKAQEKDVEAFARQRFPIMQAFRRELAGDVPPGSKGLDRDAVKRASADLYELDGKIALGRAKGMAEVLRSLTPAQKEAVGKMKFGDFASWPEKPEVIDRRSMSHESHVLVMTYASEMFSWHAGSVEADVYFCPERHGMYFGAFYTKAAPARGKRDYSISTSLTGDSGEGFLAALTAKQRKAVTDLVDQQREDIKEIVKVRREISTELRKLMADGTCDEKKVLALSRRYGELDGEMCYFYATAFAAVGKTLSAEQKAQLVKLRNIEAYAVKGAFLYSTPIAMPKAENTDWLFGVR